MALLCEKLRSKALYQYSTPYLAGAEGLEPSARGFGANVESSKTLMNTGFWHFFCEASKSRNPHSKAVFAICFAEIPRALIS